MNIKSTTIIISTLTIIFAILMVSFAMCHFYTSSQSHRDCLAPIFGETKCPTNIEPIQALAHINSLDNLSLSIIEFFSLFIFSLLIIIALVSIRKKLLALLFHSNVGIVIENIAISIKKYLRWLSILEKRDPLIFSAAIA